MMNGLSGVHAARAWARCQFAEEDSEKALAGGLLVHAECSHRKAPFRWQGAAGWHAHALECFLALERCRAHCNPNRDKNAVARGYREEDRTPFAGVQEPFWRAVRQWHTFCLQVDNLASHAHGRSARHANGAWKRCLLDNGSPLL
jgi:hypothetical protein